MNVRSGARGWTWATLALVALPWLFVARSGAQEEPEDADVAAAPAWTLTEEAERRAKRRDKFARKPASQAIDRGLTWLARSQNDEGSWDAGNGRWHRTGVTSLALHAFLRRGHHPGDAEFGHAIQRAVEYLLSCQLEDGRFWVAPAAEFAALKKDAETKAERLDYDHLWATMAMVELSLLADNPAWIDARDRALRCTARIQTPMGGYGYAASGPLATDSNLTGLAGLVLLRAADAGVPVRGMRRGSGFCLIHASTALERLADVRTGRIGYSMPREERGAFASDRAYPVHPDIDWARIGETNTALGAAVLLGDPARREDPSDSLKRSLQLIGGRAPDWPEDELEDLLYVYHAAVALKRGAALGQKDRSRWRKWQKKLDKALLARQAEDGAAAGSWPTDCVWGQFGQAYATAMCCLALDVEYSEEAR